MNYDNCVINLFINDNRLNLSNYNKLIRNKKFENLRKYLLLRFNDSNNIKESIYRILFDIQVRPVCPICGKLTNFNLGYKENTCYNTYCSISCEQKDKEVYNKQCNTKIIKYGSNNNIKKRKQTNLLKYGVEEQAQRKEILERQNKTKCNKYESSNNISKRWNTIKNNIEQYNAFINKSILFFNSNEFKEKSYNTKKKNSSFNKSKPENESYKLLKEKYPDVITQYKSKEYPFVCDFYIPSLDLYIECNYHWTHGGHPYNKNNEDDIKKLNKWKEKNTKFYNNAINTWTIRDIRKKNIAKNNNLNYLVFYSYNELYNWINLPLYIYFDWDKILNEYNYYKNKTGNLNGSTSYNFIIKYYQQDVFFKKENELIQDNNIKERLISNRCKYLNKQIEELTNNDLLLGFKRSGIYYGYSHFNPLIFKFFIEKYNIKKCYDPCGGWGHRLLGSANLELYIYNDLSPNIYKNAKRISKDLNLNNVQFYNNDANNFIPNIDFDAMFVCPPYYNIEEYECKSFENKEEYNNFIDNLFNVFYYKDSCKIFGLVIRKDLLDYKYKEKCFESFEINNKKSKHLAFGTIHNDKEYLYVFKK